jgi:hypothetical protein
MAFRHGQPPRVHVPRRQIRQPLLTEHRRRFAKQTTQLRDRDRRRLMHLQVLVHELGERYRRSSASWPAPIEHLAQRFFRFRARRKAAHLRSLGAATFEPVSVCPQRLAVGTLRLQLESGDRRRLRRVDRSWGELRPG